VDLRALLRDAPAFHVDEGLRPVSLQASPDVLATVDAAVRPGSRTLETGAGLSTVLFALRGAEHVCVTPAADEIDRIRAYCASNAIDLARVRIELGRSEAVLPRLELPELDLVLIDGGHGFPTPFVDWCYTADRLRIGGLLIVDDIHLWTGAVLRDFLAEEPGWTLRDEFPMRAVVFEKTAPTPALPEWFAQPYVARRTGARGASGAWRGGRGGWWGAESGRTGTGSRGGSRMVTGSCLCGKVRFEIDSRLTPIQYCHAARCRKATGSAFAAELAARTADFRWVSGADIVAVYEAPLLREPPPYRHASVAACGSRSGTAEGTDFVVLHAGCWTTNRARRRRAPSSSPLSLATITDIFRFEARPPVGQRCRGRKGPLSYGRDPHRQTA
jgi:hypothetical protein